MDCIIQIYQLQNTFELKSYNQFNSLTQVDYGLICNCINTYTDSSWWSFLYSSHSIKIPERCCIIPFRLFCLNIMQDVFIFNFFANSYLSIDNKIVSQPLHLQIFVRYIILLVKYILQYYMENCCIYLQWKENVMISCKFLLWITLGNYRICLLISSLTFWLLRVFTKEFNL